MWNAYKNNKHSIIEKTFDGKKAFVAQLAKKDLEEIALLRESHPKYKNLDSSVLYAIWASRKALQESGWKKNTDFGVNHRFF